MGTEQEIARGIQRQKVAQARANMAGGFGCVTTGLVLSVLFGLAGLGLWTTIPVVILAFVAGAWIYQRVLTKNLT